jgi:hypothetical protein
MPKSQGKNKISREKLTQQEYWGAKRLSPEKAKISTNVKKPILHFYCFGIL